MSTDTINIALIGAGRMGALHAHNLAAHPRYHLTCIYDSDADAAAWVSEQCKTDIAATATDAIAAGGAVLIASASDTHCDYIEQAAAAGKAILCEKPLDLRAARVEECRKNLDALSTCPPIQLGFNRRFDPGHAALAARCAAGEIGKLENLVITSRDPGLPSAAYLDACGGLFHDMMIHDFDLARALLPEEPARLVATASALIDADEGGRAHDPDTGMALLQTAGGVLCQINISRRAVYGYDQRVEAFGSKGMLISGNNTATAVEHYSATATAAREPLLHFFTERYAASYRRQLDAFAQVVLAGEAPRPTFADGQAALRLADAAVQSHKTAAWVAIQ